MERNSNGCHRNTSRRLKQENYMEYVLNIVFSPDKENVLLIFKNRPSFLANLYNFVGGKMEHDDASPVSAAFRETLEESNIITDPEYFGRVDGEGYVIHLCRSFTSNIFNAKTMEDEPVEVFHLEEVINFHNSGALAPNIMLYIQNALLIRTPNFFILKD